MFKHILLKSTFILMLFLLTACGGGDSGGASPSSSANVSYSKAILKVNLYGTLPAGSAISGVSFALFLQQPELSPALTNGIVDAGVVTPSGTFVNGIQAGPIFTPSNADTKFGKMLITLADTTEEGITQVGEVATITLQLVNHSAPPVGSILLAPYGVTDKSGSPIPTLRAIVTDVVLQ
jgi:hypothetical protein